MAAKNGVTRGLVVLWCANGHDHQMAPLQAQRLRDEPCCWCNEPIVQVDLDAIPSWEREEVESMLALERS